jgi:hypothetical protein
MTLPQHLHQKLIMFITSKTGTRYAPIFIIIIVVVVIVVIIIIVI